MKKNWRVEYDDDEQKMIRGAEDFAKNPYRSPGSGLLILVAKMSRLNDKAAQDLEDDEPETISEFNIEDVRAGRYRMVRGAITNNIFANVKTIQSKDEALIFITPELLAKISGQEYDMLRMILKQANSRGYNYIIIPEPTNGSKT
jgi:hypothetical protein